jgi:Yip1 domain
MIRALLLIFAPLRAWEHIKAARHGFGFVLVLYLVPTVVLACAAEGAGMVYWGKYRGEMPRITTFPRGETAVYEAANFLLSIAVVFIIARLIKAMGETFHGRHTFNQAFVVAAYGLGPLFLLRLLDALPGVSPWLSWGIGVLLTVAVLYSGLPHILEPDPPHAFGLYVMSCILLIMVTGLARFVTAAFLSGKFTALDRFFSAAGARLHF